MKITFFAEAGHDMEFIKAVIEKHIGTEVLQKYEIRHIPSNGWTNLHLVENEFRRTTDEGGINIVIFDADGPENDGGFTKRKQQLLNKRQELGLEFELFLFPNDSEDGMFENLLERIACNKHAGILSCFSNYENCITSQNQGGFEYRLPLLKAKIYAYVEAITDPKSFVKARKENHFFYNSPDVWDLSKSDLRPLIDFLRRYIN